MPLGEFRARVRLEDDTRAGAEEIEGSVGGLFSRLAVAAVGVGAALTQGLLDASERAQATLTRLAITTGRRSEGQQQLLSDLQRGGFRTEDEAIAAVGALAGQAGVLGLDPLDRTAAQTFAEVAAVGGDPSVAGRGLAAFGVRGTAVSPSLELGIATGLSQGVAPDELLTALREYGPVLAAFGLNYLEAAALISDLAQQGINFSRVSPALNRFIRDASRQGVPARTLGVSVFRQIAEADETTAAALGQEVFGAEGGLRLTQAIRSGTVGLEGQLALDDDVLGAPSLAALATPTGRELIDRVLAGGAIDPGSGLNRLLSRTTGLVGDIPVAGNLITSLAGGIRADDGTRRRILAETIGDVPGARQVVVNVQGSVVSEDDLRALIENVVKDITPPQSPAAGF